MSDQAYAKAQAQQKTLSGSSPKSSLLQRTCACGQHTIAGGECEECRKKREGMLQRSQRAFEPPSAPGAVQGSAPAQENGTLFNSAFDRAALFGHDFSQIPTHTSTSTVIQTKLAINKPGDEYEQEADQVAAQVMAISAGPAVSGAPPHIQRFSGQSNGQMDTAPASVDQALASPGRPLEPALQQDMEQRFGYDFSQVRVHSGAAAEQSAWDVNAIAYTVGHDIVFGAGLFAPETHEGRRLLAHELTHVVQQNGGMTVVQRAPADDTRWSRDEAAARYRGQLMAKRIRNHGKLSKEARAKIDRELAYFEGSAKEAYQKEVRPALLQVTPREEIEMPEEHVGTIATSGQMGPDPSSRESKKGLSFSSPPTADPSVREFVDEPVAGCGVCKEARFVGSEIHRLVQHNSFDRAIHAEVSLPETIRRELNREVTDPSRRLDLARYTESETYPNVAIEIGEIKPNNYNGIKDGVRDLDFYQRRLKELVLRFNPTFSVSIGLLPDAPHPNRLLYLETKNCPEQTVTVEGYDGLYFYSCDPRRSTIDKKCCKKKEEQEEQKELNFVQLALHLGQDAARRYLEKKVAKKVAEETAEKVAITWGGRAVGGLSRVAMKANLLISAADLTLSLYSELANYAYGSMYKGTRGYLLMVALQYIGTQSEKLTNAGGYALYLAETLRESEPSPDEETETLRNETFDALYRYRRALYDAMATLKGYGDEYSAIGKRIDWSGFELLKSFLEVVDGLIRNGDRSELALSMMADELTEIANWYASVIEKIYDDRDGIVHDDIRNWLAMRR